MTHTHYQKNLQATSKFSLLNSVILNTLSILFVTIHQEVASGHFALGQQSELSILLKELEAASAKLLDMNALLAQVFGNDSLQLIQIVRVGELLIELIENILRH
jgi:hypothetical protein